MIDPIAEHNYYTLKTSFVPIFDNADPHDVVDFVTGGLLSESEALFKRRETTGEESGVKAGAGLSVSSRRSFFNMSCVQRPNDLGAPDGSDSGALDPISGRLRGEGSGGTDGAFAGDAASPEELGEEFRDVLLGGGRSLGVSAFLAIARFAGYFRWIFADFTGISVYYFSGLFMEEISRMKMARSRATRLPKSW